ncbi:MAG: ABC transporter ATP-binding protein [Deltaproteobacteria bacterium]|nr:ABC transporter ATP-binding protein [Deltaproteobacteria bacterium]MBW2045344.1 ABC transporter ATP-binding protein [Deltaproteobacteria bacterium]MBW2299004.1 ABC transporter ATP-binding protein [Deltaproteobacteria bacterium]
MAVLKDAPDYQLEVEDVSISFGGIRALNNVSLSVRRGEIYSIIGPNGAGKTTLFNCIGGLYRAQKGSIKFEGKEILGKKPPEIARLGIARAFQNIALFEGMTVLDNLMSARIYHSNYGLLRAAVYLGKCMSEEVRNRDKVEEIIDFLDIQAIRKTLVGSLPYGLQKRVELGRALAMDPKLMLIDEPVSGMNLEETEDMARYLLDINEEMKVTVVLVEHDMGLVMDLSDTVTVLNFGLKIAEGSPKDIAANPEVIRAYLGETDTREEEMV